MSEVQPGDWVRFEKGGTVVLGVVLYVVRAPDSYPYSPIAITDLGRVRLSDILERRSVSAFASLPDAQELKP